MIKPDDPNGLFAPGSEPADDLRLQGQPHRVADGPEPAPSRLLLPREHGAWSMLLQPFVAGLILAREFHWSAIPAVLAVLLAFVVREPLIVLGRQAHIWKQPRPEALVARKNLYVELPVLAVCGGLLLLRGPWPAWLALAAGAALLTLLAVWMTVRNWQRSIPLQLISAAGLSASVLAAALAILRAAPAWAWAAWLMFTLHGGSAVLVVHTRLQARIAARTQSEADRNRADSRRRGAYAAQAVLLGAAGISLLTPRSLLALPLALSALAHVRDLAELRGAEGVNTPLRRVGWRAVGLSLAFSALVMAGLW
jgi:hypothetical protein